MTEGAAFGVEGEDVVEEEGRGGAGKGDEDESVKLASLAKGGAAAGRGATMEEGGCNSSQGGFAIVVADGRRGHTTN